MPDFIECYCCGADAPYSHRVFPQSWMKDEPSNVVNLCPYCYRQAGDKQETFRFLVSKMEPDRFARLERMSVRSPKDPMYGEVA